jgi:hypothetical protein
MQSQLRALWVDEPRVNAEDLGPVEPMPAEHLAMEHEPAGHTPDEHDVVEHETAEHVPAHSTDDLDRE